MEYKIHQYRFDNFTKFEAIIREAMNLLGHKEGNNPDINIYNHCYQSEVSTNKNIIFKPTAPTSNPVDGTLWYDTNLTADMYIAENQECRN